MTLEPESVLLGLNVFVITLLIDGIKLVLSRAIPDDVKLEISELQSQLRKSSLGAAGPVLQVSRHSKS